MKKTSFLVLMITFFLCLTSCTSKNNDVCKIVYPSQFVLSGKEYISNHKWADEHNGEYTLGDIIGYLIYIDDEDDFINDYPGVEYVTFDIVIGNRCADKFDRVPVYEINEYKDRSIIAVSSIAYIYEQIINE